MSTIKASLFVVLTFVVSGASAALIDNGIYVTDDVTKIDYLKLGQTAGLSWREVVTNDSEGLIADGWSIASQSGFQALVANYGADAETKLKPTGVTKVFTDNGLQGGQFFLFGGAAFYDTWPDATTYTLGSDVGGEYHPVFQINADTAAAFTRPTAAVISPSAVPIPAAGYLLLSALVGLGGMKRCTKKKV